MDTSKEYIKMCEKATKIQEKIRNFEVEELYIGCSCGKYLCGIRGLTAKHDEVWLPRQDQLQEILNEKRRIKLEPVLIIKKLLDCINKHKFLHETLEQITLMFVMEEKYNKFWGGEEWVG